MTSRKALSVYLVLTLAISAIFWTLIIWSKHLSAGFGYVFGLMWSPGAAALLTCRILTRDVRSLGWTWPQRKYVVLSYVIPLAYAAVAYGTVWITRQGGFNSDFVTRLVSRFGLSGMPPAGVLVLYLVLASTVGVIQSVSSALGEEIGWRGFLVPELAKVTSFTKVSLISGVIWAAWHTPILLFADYNAGTNRWYGLACFSVMVISISFIFAWMRLASGSLWTGAILHASHNLFVQAVFDNFMRDTGRTLWLTTEFGAALALSAAGCALLFWTKRNQLSHLEAAPQTVAAKAS
ncbi:MAG: CPBP family intramembrane metalloprotease domain-containing protein [Acidobacteria bacterium]|nr:MAG: CPBP family intramembrane metalloprotease domain-containing protein [Acidobacteriota bacterium]